MCASYGPEERTYWVPERGTGVMGGSFAEKSAKPVGDARSEPVHQAVVDEVGEDGLRRTDEQPVLGEGRGKDAQVLGAGGHALRANEVHEAGQVVLGDDRQE